MRRILKFLWNTARDAKETLTRTSQHVLNKEILKRLEMLDKSYDYLYKIRMIRQI